MSALPPTRAIVLVFVTLISAALLVPILDGQQPLWTQMQNQAQRQQQAQQKQDAQKSVNKEQKKSHTKKEKKKNKKQTSPAPDSTQSNDQN